METILTFHNAAVRSVDKLLLWEADDPGRKRPCPSPYTVYEDNFDFVPKGYPVQWDNKGDDLIVTITLPELRPHPPRNSTAMTWR